MVERNAQSKGGVLRRMAYRSLDAGTSLQHDPFTPRYWFVRQPRITADSNVPRDSGLAYVESPYISWYSKIWGVNQLTDMPVWRNMYRTVPIIKKAIDKTVMSVVTNFNLYLDENVPNQEKIIGYLMDWVDRQERWREILQQIAHDLLVYGNAYLELVYEDSEVTEGWELDQLGNPVTSPRKVNRFTQDGDVKYNNTKEGLVIESVVEEYEWDGKMRQVSPVKGSKLKWLKTVDPLHMRVRMDAYGNVFGYLQWLAYPPVAFTPDNLLHFRFFPKSWSYERAYGTSMLMSLVRTQNIIWTIENDLVLITHAAAKPPLVYKCGPPENPYSDGQLDTFTADIAKRGPGGDVVVRGDVETKELPQPSQNLAAIISYLEYHKEQRIVALGVPPQLLGVPEGSTRTTAAVNLDDWIGTVKRLQETIAEELRDKIFKKVLVDGGFPENTPVPQIVWQEMIPKDENSAVQRVVALLGAGVITVNEARDLLTETGRKFERFDDVPEADKPRVALGGQGGGFVPPEKIRDPRDYKTESPALGVKEKPLGVSSEKKAARQNEITINPPEHEIKPHDYVNVYKRKLFDIAGQSVYLVDMNEVKTKFDARWGDRVGEYIAGHSLVFSYIPKNEIWVSDALPDGRWKMAALHEYAEWVIMREHGTSYVEAHKLALAIEEAAISLVKEL